MGTVLPHPLELDLFQTTNGSQMPSDLWDYYRPRQLVPVTNKSGPVLDASNFVVNNARDILGYAFPGSRTATRVALKAAKAIMPYVRGRRTRNLRGTTRRRTFASARRAGGRTYPANRATVRIPTAPRSEVKCLNFFGTTFPVIRSGANGFAELGPVAFGTAANQRLGNVIRAISLQIGVYIQKVPSASNCFTCRVLLCRWDQGYVSPSPIAFIEGSDAFIGPYQQENAKNYKVLMDRTVNLPPSGVLTTTGANIAQSHFAFNDTIRLDKEVTFTATAGTDGDSRFFIMFFGSDDINGEARVSAGYRYIDV